MKRHPSYSGAIMTSTFAMARDLGWEYFEKLSKQKVMQVQSAVDPPKKVALGERAVMADGADYIALQLKQKGSPIEIVIPLEGAPIVNSPNALFKQAPIPYAARLFSQLVLLGRRPAEARGRHRTVCAARPRGACPGAPPTQGHQDHAGRPRGAAQDRRRGQGQVRRNLQGLGRVASPS